MSKPIDQMTDEELAAELELMRSTRVPTQPLPKAPKRLDAKAKGTGKRKSIFDQLMDKQQ